MSRASFTLLACSILFPILVCSVATFTGTTPQSIRDINISNGVLAIVANIPIVRRVAKSQLEVLFLRRKFLRDSLPSFLYPNYYRMLQRRVLSFKCRRSFKSL